MNYTNRLAELQAERRRLEGRLLQVQEKIELLVYGESAASQIWLSENDFRVVVTEKSPAATRAWAMLFEGSLAAYVAQFDVKLETKAGELVSKQSLVTAGPHLKVGCIPGFGPTVNEFLFRWIKTLGK